MIIPREYYKSVPDEEKGKTKNPQGDQIKCFQRNHKILIGHSHAVLSIEASIKGFR